MYVVKSGVVAGGDGIQKKAPKKSVGGFSELLSESEIEEAQASGASSVSSTSQLLFMQEVGDEDSGKREAVTQGFDIIKYLDNIRMGLLSGMLSKETLLGLDSILQKFKKNFTDPQLANILDEIELRAKVELAKLSRD